MTKSESAHITAQTVLLESAEQVLQLRSAAGVRLAIPDTNNLIMVGTGEWIAANVPGAEVMIERLTRYTFGTLFGGAMVACRDGEYVKFAAIARLAATTQASTAQAERPLLPSGWKVTQEPGVIVVQKAGVGGIALGPRYNSDGDIAASIFEQFLKDLLAEAFAPVSTDAAQAAVEVRDGCEHCIGTYCLLGEKCSHCGHEAESQGVKRSAGDTGGAA